MKYKSFVQFMTKKNMMLSQYKVKQKLELLREGNTTFITVSCIKCYIFRFK